LIDSQFTKLVELVEEYLYTLDSESASELVGTYTSDLGFAIFSLSDFLMWVKENKKLDANPDKKYAKFINSGGLYQLEV